MTLFPIVERELRVASRRPWTYWGRSVSGLLSLLLTSWILLAQSITQLKVTGQALFSSVSYLALAFAAFAGVTYTSDCVSSEKREGTLGLLFLTDLNGFDVALGKVAATSLGAFYGLLALLPVMALGMLMGGVTAGEYLRMVLFLVSILILSLSSGLAVSVFCRDSRRAASGTFLLVVAMFALCPLMAVLSQDLIEWIGGPLTRAPWSTTVARGLERMSRLSPAVAFSHIDDAAFKQGAGAYWKAELWTGLMVVGLLALACFRLPRSWQERGAKDTHAGWRAWLEAVRFPDLAAKRAFRRRLLDSNPSAWIAGRYWLRPLLVWAFFALFFLCFGYGAWRMGASWWNALSYFATSFLLHAVLKVWIANEAPRQFLEDRRTGALELLLTTPFEVSELLVGRRVALLRQFGGPIVVVMALDAIFLVLSLRSEFTGGEESMLWAMVWLARIAFLPLDALTLYWMGMWKGMTSQGTRSSSWIVMVGLGLPNLLWILLLTLLGLMSVAGQGNWMTPGKLLLLWVVLGVANSMFWMSRSRSWVVPRFRELACEQMSRSGAKFLPRPGAPASPAGAR